MKRKRNVLLLLLAVCFLAACGTKTVNIQEQMELGQKYLVEENYEEAIVAFTKVISIDPKNEEAGRSLAAAYQGAGKEEQAADAMATVILQGGFLETDLDSMNAILGSLDNLDAASALTEMMYTQTGDERFIRTLFSINGKRNDFDAIEQSIRDLEMFKGMKDEYLEDIVQYYADNGDIIHMKKLSEILEKQKACDSIVLVLDMWTKFEEGGEAAVIELLEAYYTEGKELPYIEPNDEIYIGGYDDKGLRSGYGICFYGSEVKTHSRIYMGNWEEGVRSGEGRAYL